MIDLCQQSLLCGSLIYKDAWSYQTVACEQVRVGSLLESRTQSTKPQTKSTSRATRGGTSGPPTPIPLWLCRWLLQLRAHVRPQTKPFHLKFVFQIGGVAYRQVLLSPCSPPPPEVRFFNKAPPPLVSFAAIFWDAIQCSKGEAFF